MASKPSSNPPRVSGSIIAVKLNYSNYKLWAKAVTKYLIGQGKHNYLTQDSSSSDSKEYTKWIKEDNLITTSLWNSMEPSLAAIMMSVDTTKELWTSLQDRFEGNQLCAIKIRGTAFLWHQVRCMVAVLFMIGQGLESDEVIDALLDTERTPRKPQYVMAPEIPLVLLSCEFEGLQFTCSEDARQALHVHLQNECQKYQLQAAIYHEALLFCLPLANDKSLLKTGIGKKKASHVPLFSRPTEPSYEERRAKLDSKR